MKKTITALTTLMLGMNWQVCSAADLLEVYRTAYRNDPTFQSQRAVFMAATQAYPEARALLLPNIQYNMEGGYNDSDIKSAFIPLPAFTGKNNWYDINYIARLSQPIVNFGAWFNVQVAKAAVKQASATFAAEEQDLAFRVARAYFEVLQAEDQLRFTRAELAATKRQLEQMQQRFNVGLEAITSVYDAQATYDEIAAREIANENDVQNAKEALSQLTGVYYDKLASLDPHYPLLHPSPENKEAWVEAVEKQNFNIDAQRFAVEGSRENINVNFSGHLPNVTFEGDYVKTNTTNSGIGSPGDRDLARAQLRLNLPVYEGGLIAARTRQAKFGYQQALADLEDVTRQSAVSARQTYNDIITGINKIGADKQAIKSRISSLESTEAALNVGTRTIVDLLIAQQQLFQTQSVLALDTYAYILNMLRLKQFASILTVIDLARINRWLTYHPQRDTAFDYDINTHVNPLLPSSANTPSASSTSGVSGVDSLTTTSGKNTSDLRSSSATESATSRVPKATTPEITSTSVPSTKVDHLGETVTPTSQPMTTVPKAIPPGITSPSSKADHLGESVAVSASQKQSSDRKTVTQKALMPRKKSSVDIDTKTDTTSLLHNEKPSLQKAEAKVIGPSVSGENSQAKSNQTKYTIQLMGSHDKQQLESFVHTNQLGAVSEIRSKKALNGQNWYELHYGKYQTKEQAEAALNALPTKIQNLKPWVKSLED